MTPKERLRKLLEFAGVSKKDCDAWLERIDALPFSRAEALVYVLEQLDKKDTVFLDKNLKEKIEFARTGIAAFFDSILVKEKIYLSQD